MILVEVVGDGMNRYLEEQIKMHPSMQMQDVVKLCYQAAYGAEHLLSDEGMARRYFETEFGRLEPADIPLFENISDNYCRVNMAAWKYHNKPMEQLFDLFVRTARQKVYDEEILLELLEEAAVTIESSETNFSADEFRKYSVRYMSAGCPVIHHSDEYRAGEKPAYRLVRRTFI